MNIGIAAAAPSRFVIETLRLLLIPPPQSPGKDEKSTGLLLGNGNSYHNT